MESKEEDLPGVRALLSWIAFYGRGLLDVGLICALLDSIFSLVTDHLSPEQKGELEENLAIEYDSVRCTVWNPPLYLQDSDG